LAGVFDLDVSNKLVIFKRGVIKIVEAKILLKVKRKEIKTK
jgi:hypothetical protein